MENQCYVCHSPTATEAERIGPPMAAIKARYVMEYPEKSDFVAALWRFVEKPSEEKALMKGAVRRFGLMPYQHYEQTKIKNVAAFLYDYEVEEPSWFAAHWNERHGDGNYQQQGKPWQTDKEEAKTPTELGMHYASTTKQLLGKNLMGTIQKKGTMAALEFCNVQAYPLTDSMATVYGARIKRVSDRPRNPENKASAKERKHIERFKLALARGETYEPIVEEDGTDVHFYYPIITNTKCLQCHGVPNKDISSEVHQGIKQLYPKDLAVDYKVNEVRGMWSIHFSETP
ncbi:DUF3365 domain-containing protein [Maribacter sp. 2307ULW6-5]|uniref:c-type heme family protein n=1 Tax=Maribacter sp. 2307ULW6-5 TaxID=3386275 RepID=UPI0039BC9D5D